MRADTKAVTVTLELNGVEALKLAHLLYLVLHSILDNWGNINKMLGAHSSGAYESWEIRTRGISRALGVDLLIQHRYVLLGETEHEAVGVAKHCIVTNSWWDTVDANA